MVGPQSTVWIVVIFVISFCAFFADSYGMLQDDLVEKEPDNVCVLTVTGDLRFCIFFLSASFVTYRSFCLKEMYRDEGI